MAEVGGGLDLAEEALGAERRRQLGPQHLDGDLAVVLEVLGEIDRGHAALAELALDAVAIAEGLGEAVRRRRSRRGRPFHHWHASTSVFEKSSPDEQQRLTPRHRQGVTEAVAEVQRGRMPAASEPERGIAREHHLLLSDRHDLGTDSPQQPIEQRFARFAVAAQEDQ